MHKEVGACKMSTHFWCVYRTANRKKNSHRTEENRHRNRRPVAIFLIGDESHFAKSSDVLSRVTVLHSLYIIKDFPIEHVQ